MTCKNIFGSSDDRFLRQQEHRNISRLWQRAIKNISSSGANFNLNFLNEEQNDFDDSSKREVRFRHQGFCGNYNLCEPSLENELPSENVLKKIAKGKSFAKLKSPLQKFDEIVTRELNNRRLLQEGGIPSFDGPKKWSNLEFSGSKFLDFGKGKISKISAENKVSRGALHSVEKDVKNEDPSEVENTDLMDAIEKLAQAQAVCRFEAAVKAAEAATASVPPEKAEEVAVACAKDYQSEIVDMINEKIPLSEEKKPVEVIGYIAITKMKDCI